MSKRHLIMLYTVLTLSIGGALFGYRKYQMHQTVKGDIINLQYHSGDGRENDHAMSFYQQDGKGYLQLQTTPSRVDDGTIQVYEIELSVFKTLTRIAEENHIEQWDGFHESDTNVMDGTSWYFEVTYSTGDKAHISAGGYMRRPQGFGTVNTELEDLVETITHEYKPLP